MPARKRRAVSRRAGAELVEHAADARGLQPGKLHRQRFAGGAGIKQPLAAIVGALLLHDIAFIDQLLEHAAERLLGDFQNIEQLGDLHAGIAIDEMQDAMVRAAEAELFQHLVGIADEVAIGEEQKLDEVPAGLARFGGRFDRRRGAERSLRGVVKLMSAIMSALLTYFGLVVTPKTRYHAAASCRASPRARRLSGRRTALS